MEYWSDFEGENNGNNQSFYACADIVCNVFLALSSHRKHDIEIVSDNELIDFR